MTKESRRPAFFALGVIFAANFLNYLDRQLVSALEEPLNHSLHIEPAEFGFLWTLFTIGYMLCAVPIGLLADRWNRPRLLAACVAIWSLATVATGFAQDKPTLYVARVLTGVGEAGCLVVGPALISDLFAPRMLGRALSIFYLGLPLGGTAAFLLAGAFYGIGWRNLFLLAGFPGLLVAAVLLLVPDPRTAAPHAHAPSPLRSYLGLLRTRSLLYVILAQACAVVVLIPIIHFGVHFFEETRGMAAREARIAIGLIALIAGSLGNAVSGVLGDRLSQRFRGAYALLAGTSFLLGWPCLLFGFFLESRWLFLPAITAGCFFYFLCMPAVNAHIARVVRPNERAMAWALATFVLHLLGDMLSPPLFGIVSEGIGRRDTFAIFSLGIVVAGLLCLLAARTAGSDAEHARYRPLHQPSPKRPQ